MGGRAERQQLADRETWIKDVSDSRLQSYERMLLSSVADTRVDGADRTIGQKSYFADLIQRERARRST